MSRSTNTLDILFVDDDIDVVSPYCERMEKEFGPTARIRTVKSEMEFFELFPAIEATPPDIIILDMILRWSEPCDHVQIPPDEVRSDGHYRAGLRCFRRLQSVPATRAIPVIFFSVVGRTDIPELSGCLPPHVLFVQKPCLPAELSKFVRALVHHLPEGPTKRRTFLQRAFAAAEAKPGALGFKIDLKKLFDDKRT